MFSASFARAGLNCIKYGFPSTIAFEVMFMFSQKKRNHTWLIVCGILAIIIVAVLLSELLLHPSFVVFPVGIDVENVPPFAFAVNIYPFASNCAYIVFSEV